MPKRKQSVGSGRGQGVVGVTTEPKRKCNVGSGEVGEGRTLTFEHPTESTPCSNSQRQPPQPLGRL